MKPNEISNRYHRSCPAQEQKAQTSGRISTEITDKLLIYVGSTPISSMIARASLQNGSHALEPVLPRISVLLAVSRNRGTNSGYGINLGEGVSHVLAAWEFWKVKFFPFIEKLLRAVGNREIIEGSEEPRNY